MGSVSLREAAVESASGDKQELRKAFARYWDQRAPDYDLEPQHVFCSEGERQLWIGLLQSLCRGKPRVVLDVGTGTGLGHLLDGLGGEDEGTKL